MLDSIQSTPSDPSILTFPALVHYELSSRSLDTVRTFFEHLRLPTIEKLQVDLFIPPTELELKSFLAVLPGACSHKSLSKILIAPYSTGRVLPPYHISFHHLRPLAVFANIRIIHLMIPCGLDLSERELLQLASSWPLLEVLIVGKNEGSTASSSITPAGFVQLLERCRWLSRFNFTFDTHGYTEIPQGHPWNGLRMPDDTEIHVRHSAIEEESVEPLAIFFHVTPFPKFRLIFRSAYANDERLPKPLNLYRDRWKKVRSLAYKLWEERQKLLHSLKSHGRNATHRDVHVDGNTCVDRNSRSRATFHRVPFSPSG
ncbi:hypothetical protein OG21DRAFT_204611 [Imleria badia]|nr:hypothetical protein OG21DRAFT_204611 [Imleria badia]